MNAPTKPNWERPAPCEPISELAVVSSVMISASVLDEIGGIVRQSDFFDKHLGKVYAGLQAIHEAGRRTDDPITTIASLIGLGCVIDHAEFGRIYNAVPHVGEVIYYAERVRSFADKRRLIELGSTLIDQGHSREAVAGLLTAAEESLATIRGNAGRKGVTIGEAAKAVVKAIYSPEERIEGKPLFWSLPKIDELVGPLMPGEVAIVAARPGCGKTALGVQVALHAALHGRRVAFFSLEMNAEELASRVMCSWAQIDSRKVRRRDLSETEAAKLEIQSERMADLPIVIFDTPSEPISRIRGISRYEKKSRGLDAVFVDYLGLIAGEKGEDRFERHEAVRRISLGLKNMAKELGVPVVCLCQLNRGADGVEPKLSNLRESGAIEQDADMVFFIHHTASEANLIAAKHRHGAAGTVRLKFIPQETRFVEPEFPTPTASRVRDFDDYNHPEHDPWT